MVHRISGSTLIGREKELNEMFDDLRQDKSIRLLIGESGIGKSALLDEFYRALVEDMRDELFVGYYSRKESLIAESESLIYPFRILLESFVKQVKESQHLDERVDNTIARVKRGLLRFGKEQGVKMGVAIIEDLAKKVGLQQTLEVGKDVIKAIGDEKTSLMLAQGYVADHKDEARESYLNIFKAIADEFKERKFVLIFDQFENVGKASTDFFLNFAKFVMMEDRFHIIVSFRTDNRILNDLSKRNVFEDLRSKINRELGGKITELGGLSAQDIGKWIRMHNGITLPMVPDLQRIRENSGGLPMLLDVWIKSFKDMNYEGWIKSFNDMNGETEAYEMHYVVRLMN
jgi:archaellum biogenesis ATPase FlaH